MKDLKTMWGGDWASTLRHLKEETLKGKIEGDRTEEGKRMEEGLLSEGNGDKRKRKRPEAESREGSIDIGAERAKKTRKYFLEDGVLLPSTTMSCLICTILVCLQLVERRISTLHLHLPLAQRKHRQGPDPD